MKTYKLLIPAVAMFAISNGAFAGHTGLLLDADTTTYVSKCKVIGKDHGEVVVMSLSPAACANISGTIVTPDGTVTSTVVPATPVVPAVIPTTTTTVVPAGTVVDTDDVDD